MITLLFALSLGAPALSDTTRIVVGGADVRIPAPAGFSAVTPAMSALRTAQAAFVPPTNVEFASFIPDASVAAALRQEVPALPRRFVVQTARNLVDAPMTAAHFAEMKQTLRSQNDAMLAQLEAALPGLSKRVNDQVLATQDVDLAFTVSQMLPLPVHEESPRTFAFSMLTKFSAKDASGATIPFRSASTATFAHVSGRVIFLYAFGAESDLEWTREASRQWAGAVIAANSAGGSVGALGIDWGRAARAGVLGALGGVVLMLMRQLFSRRKTA